MGESVVFITGASGLTGRNIAEPADNDPKRKPNLKIVEGDVTDVTSPSGFMEGWTVVIQIQ